MSEEPWMSRSSRQMAVGRNVWTSPLPPPEHKVAYVQNLFTRIARRYDLMNRVMTVGRDRTWRRAAVAQVIDAARAVAAGGRGPLVLDVATGTGDLALETLRQEPAARVVGVDFVPAMLALASEKSAACNRIETSASPSDRLELTLGDALCLPFPDGLFDAVVTGFALRNVTDIPAAIAEMARVTRPGGRLACLEIAKPRLPFFRHLFDLYFYRLVPLVGGWITGYRAAYAYLPHSLTAFLSPEEIANVMRGTGWGDIKVQRLMLGTVALHSATRAGSRLHAGG